MSKQVIQKPQFSMQDWLRPALIAGLGTAAMVAIGELNALLGLILSTVYWLPLFLVGFRFGTLACATSAVIATLAAVAAGLALHGGIVFGLVFSVAISLPTLGLVWLFHRRDAFGLPLSPQRIAGIVIAVLLGLTAIGVLASHSIFSSGGLLQAMLNETGMLNASGFDIDCAQNLGQTLTLDRPDLFNTFVSIYVMGGQDPFMACHTALEAYGTAVPVFNIMVVLAVSLVIGFTVGLMLANASYAQTRLEKRGFLPRPAVHPHLIHLPWWFGALTGLSALLTFILPAGSLGQAMAVNLMMMSLFIMAGAGLWTIHAFAPRKHPLKFMFLLVAYILVLISFTTVAMAIGIIDQLFGLRSRLWRRRQDKEQAARA